MSIKALLILAAVALTTTAFAMPTMAGAEIVLIEEEEALEPGAELTATGAEFRVHNGANTVSCEKVVLHFETLINDYKEEHAVLDSAGEGEAQECTANNWYPTTLKDVAILTPLTLGQNAVGWLGLRFTWLVYMDAEHTMLLQECEFFGVVRVSQTFSEEDVIEIGPSIVVSQGEIGSGCATQGTVEGGQFTLETDDGTRVELRG